MLRKNLFMLVLGITLPFMATNAMAASENEARQFVDGVGKQVLGVVNSQASDKKQQLETMFTQHVDMDWMAKFVLGAGWTQANEEQRARYVQAYKSYLLSRYTNNFADYAGSKYTITGVNIAADGQYIVGMSVEAPKAEDTQVQAGYRVHKAADGQFKIIDIIVEGVSLLTTQRAEFNSVVQKNGIEKLIEQLQVKTVSKT